MTTVYITRSGTKYHATDGCPSFDDAEREHGRTIGRWARDLKGLTHVPCSVCWPSEPNYDTWVQLGLEVERCGDSPYEALFVERVLRHVPGLRPSEVSTQRKASGRTGNTYFLDFVVSPSGGHRVAIEIDGTDKDPGGKSTAEVLRDVERKRADLVDAGWRVLNFSNDRVATRSEECVIELRAALQDSINARNPNDEAIVAVQTPPRSTPSVTDSPVTLGAEAIRQRPRWGRRVAWALGFVAVVGVLAVGRSLGSRDVGGPVKPVGGECPAEAPIKGNVSQSGEKIHHEPGWQYYTRTYAEECFASSDDAESAGYRASEAQ